MKICVWKTGHGIADTIGGAVHEGLPESIFKSTSDINQRAIDEAEIHICYGILRGADSVFRMAEKARKAWINIDSGYWKPGHYDGYYRISLNGTQQTFGLDKLEPDYDRWDKLGLEILPAQERVGGSLVCPVTDYVKTFFRDMDYSATVSLPFPLIKEPAVLRLKGCERPLQDDLDKCANVVTFNSSVGWEALRQGIPVVSGPTHSIVGAFQKTVDKPLHMDYEARRKLFSQMAGLQLTLEEMREGLLWPVIQRLLSISTLDGMAEKQ